MPEKPLDFQNMIFALQTFWSGQGCLIAQPYYSQLGAGTMNPSTFLRVLGPEPWKVAYVEPSVRPDDGRYGINPNRLQQHHQFQVILKPDPGNPQEIYLKSLEAIGIKPEEHDIRFVEDNWESPALSAWGLGWEVWLDGQEITQFTYFQQSGGVQLEVPAVEITYGLERIAMTLQRVRHFKDIQWSSERSYGDIFQVAEREHSTYYFEVADVQRLRQLFSLHQAEAELALEKGLVLPAYDNVIKCSHIFNIMDTRGAVSYTERMALFGRMRELSRKVSEAYLAQRQELEFPWLSSTEKQAQPMVHALPNLQTDKADLLLEIGTEELPVADLESGLAQFGELLNKLLSESRLAYSILKVEGTPRRLVAKVFGLQTQQADRKVEVKGPPADRAFDAQGHPTKAAEGFARSRGIELSSLQVKDNYVVVELEEKGLTAAQILAEKLPALYSEIRFTKSMRWNSTGVAFSRPVRWLLALFGSQVLPISFAGVESSNTTRGLRFSKPTDKEVNSIQDYDTYLSSEGIILDPSTRKSIIWAQAQAIAAQLGGQLPEDGALLDEVSNLVERPTAILGTFDERYLQSLPAEVLIGVMKKHQRYFPVLGMQGKLMNHFVLVRNGDESYADIVADGNLQVVHARFADAEFFVKQDAEKKISDLVPALDQLTFQKQLGTMLDKTHRIARLVDYLGKDLALNTAELEISGRVAQLAKADLASAMVVEMTELQGVMGKYYALNSGESQAVAEGIFEHYLPRFSGDALPSTKAGLVVGIADRMDSIAGLFAAGLAPTGNKDPFALRRTAMGLCQLLIGKGLDFDLKPGLREAGQNLPFKFTIETQNAVEEFIVGRLRGLLLEKGLRYDVVEAVIKANPLNPARASANAETLNRWLTKPEWTDLLPAYSRTVRITRDLAGDFPVHPEKMVELEEKALYSALQKAEEQLKREESFETALAEVNGLREPINTFFGKVLVMAEDEDLRKTRLGMLIRIAGLL
ncbi:MAG TPA: glycine--tRNA ligase subunit beta, partial [Anaerolineaceae bacterium]|nr:glycine--tRNA ligase subunit beta [Anaerolineaceae bacterium]